MPAPTHAYPSCVSSACEKLVGLTYPAAPTPCISHAPAEYDVTLADTVMSRSRGCPSLPAPCVGAHAPPERCHGHMRLWSRVCVCVIVWHMGVRRKSAGVRRCSR
eukprot:1446999-Prymnesium_polylepis.1